MKLIRRAFAAFICTYLIFSLSLSAFSENNPMTSSSKKGILINSEADLAAVLDLSVSHVIMNFPISYAYNEAHFKANEQLLKTLNGHGISVTLIVLNDWASHSINPSLLPVSAPVSGASYYAFNTLNASGISATMDAASRVTGRLSPYVSSWVIGNEVNDGMSWNYIGSMDIDSYSRHYASAFRIWYDKIKVNSPSANVYIPFDFRWNHGAVSGYKYTVRELLPRLNESLRDTDYGLAWHAYPESFEDPVFTDDKFCTNDINTYFINLKNLSVLTSFMESQDMRAPDGSVRTLALTEQGFTSFSNAHGGECQELQLNAIREAYKAAEENPYVNSFMLNRLRDDAGLVSRGYSFGLLDLSGSPKAAYEMYKYIDK